MPRSAKDNLQIREARRDEILAAAKRTFAEKGFAGAKIAEIAAEAGLSHGLIYHYFNSKEAILLEIVHQMTHELEADTVSSEPRAVDRVAAVIARRRAGLQDPLNAARLVLQAALQGSLSEEAKAEVHAHFERFAACQREWIAQAQAAGDVDDTVDADEIMRILSYLLRGMCVRVHGDTRPQLPLPLPSAEAIMQLLLPPPRTARPKPVKRASSPKTKTKTKRKRP